MRQALLGLVTLVCLTSCLPIDLDVAPDGRIVVPRQEGVFTIDPANGEVQRITTANDQTPAFALFMPDGERIVTITQADSNQMGGMFVFNMVNMADGESREIHRASNVTYASISPDGKQLALTRVADQAGALEENLPELQILDLASGATKKLASDSSVLFRWFPDSQALLYFQLVAKDQETGAYSGTLNRVTVGGESEALTERYAGKSVFIDLAPDGRQAVFTATPEGEVGENEFEEPAPRLYALDIAGGQVKELARDVAYAIYSPDGGKLLVGGEGDDDLLSLTVADTGLHNRSVVAPRVPKEAGAGLGQATAIYPGWVDEDTVYYIGQRAAFGTAAVNFELVTVNADGSDRKNLQAMLDAAAVE